MSNISALINELPIISSKIQIDSELLSKKSTEMKQKKVDGYKSTESIKIGDGIPKSTITKTKSSKVTVVKTEETNNLIQILSIIFFLILAGSSYFYFVNSGKNK